MMVRHHEPAKHWLQRWQKKAGKAKALAVLQAKIGRAVYHMLR